MIYQPRNVTPSNISIDTRITNQNFSMEINTNDKVTAYQLYIYNWNNTVKYTGSKTNLSTPLYNGDTLYIPIPNGSALPNGYDYKWNVKLFQNTADMQITKGIFQAISSSTSFTIQTNINIKVGMYLSYNNADRQITAYNTNTGVVTIASAFSTNPTVGASYTVYSDFIQTIPEYILYARENPTVSVTTIPGTVTTKKYTFNATYTQNNKVPMTYHRWTLYINRGGGELELVEDTGKIYNANLQYSYDGLKTGVDYAIELDVETEFGVWATSGLKYFTVQYQTIEYLQKPVAAVDCNKNAIRVEWIAPTDFAPKLINDKVAAGEVQAGTIGEHTFYIQKGLNIGAGNYIYFNHIELEITNYNSSTGLVTILEDTPETLVEGSRYYIIGPTNIPINSAVTLYRGVPYEGVNSVDTKNYSLVYENENEGFGIGTYPDEYNLTMQFKPDEQFFFGTGGVFNDLNLIGSIESDDDDGLTGLLLLFVHIYKMGAVWPLEDNTGHAIVYEFPSGYTNTKEYAYLAEDIDLDLTSYIYFPQYNYLENISSYDATNNKAIFNKPLPFIPEAGEEYVMMNTLTTEFYENPQNTWVLQTTNFSQSDLDYRWIDENNTWNDTKFWVEGGTAIIRVAEYWWKLHLTKEFIKVERGGV